MVPDHEYTPNVINCSEHDMGDCPYHKGGPCQHREDFNGEVCGLPADAHDPNVWAPRGRLPMGQYRITMILTGDDIGPDALALMIERQGSSLGFIVGVERMERIGGSRS